MRGKAATVSALGGDEIPGFSALTQFFIKSTNVTQTKLNTLHTDLAVLAF
jgi:hypothetical protein